LGGIEDGIATREQQPRTAGKRFVVALGFAAIVRELPED
jgi:hypothetical protein